jgi:dimeric dUTPase (all-alpha-NTP-PPase superfamily)
MSTLNARTERLFQRVHPGQSTIRLSQMRLKDMFWRATEEFAEALESVPPYFMEWRDRWDSCPQTRHVMEELVDALHFFVEASIISGFEHKRLPSTFYYIVFPPCELVMQLRELCMDVIVEMGLAANCLKNKPWKNTHMETDKQRFMHFMSQAWGAFNALWVSLGFKIEDVYVLYCKKHTVNQFRQRSNY